MRAATVVRAILVGLIGMVSMVTGIWYWLQWDRVEPGNVGVLINFRTGEIRSVPPAQWVWLDWRNERLVEYPASERSLIMVAKPDEGQVKSDDSVECRTSDRQVLKIDSRSIGDASSASIARSASSIPNERWRPSSPENVKITQSTPGARSVADTAVASHAK